jgi:predicted dehydrogenase
VKHFFNVPFELKRKVICARNRVRLEEMAATWGWQETATDWRAVIDRKDIAHIYILNFTYESSDRLHHQYP